MRIVQDFLARIGSLFHRDATADEIREELEFHVEARTTQYEEAGLTPGEARRRAQTRVGSIDVYQARGYRVRGSGLMETIRHDVRYAIRLLWKQPGFTALAVLTLALGIGASTAIFSVIDAALLRPLPYPNPEQLVGINVAIVQSDGREVGPTPSMDDLRFWQEQREVFAHVAGYGRAFFGTIADGPEPERVETLGITEDYLALHGTAPMLGRDFNFSDMALGAPPVVILGHDYWQRRFGGRPEVVGETIRYDGSVATIVGVLPASFQAEVPILRPLHVEPDRAVRRGTGTPTVYGRLLPGVTLEQAAERLSAVMPDQVARDGSTRKVDVKLYSRFESAIERNSTTVWIVAAAVGFILLIACVNVAGLLLGRGATRQAELAVRASLGAGRGRLLRQLLTESLVLACAGAALGVLLAWLSLDVIVANIPMSLPADASATLNLTVLAATAGLAVPTALLFGLLPAWRLSRTQLTSSLNRAARQSGGTLSRRSGQTLMAVEVALAVVLVVGAGLMLRSFARISAVDLGFDADGLVTMDVVPLEPSPDAQADFFARLLPGVRALGGIEAAGGINFFQLGEATAYSSVSVNGQSTGVNPFYYLPGYFEAIRLPLVAGRYPTDADFAPGVNGAVLGESAAREIFPDGSAIGRQFNAPGVDQPFTVVGVVGDVLHGGPLGEMGNQAYLPYRPSERSYSRAQAITIVMRLSGRVPDLAARLRQIAQGIGPRVLVERIRSGDDWFGERVVTPRRRTVLLSLLGGLGLVLALVGVFGMTAFAVARRAREIGVRMVFGARPAQVVGRVLRDAALPIVIGTAVGLGGAALTTRVIQSFLFETDPVDPLTFITVAVVLILTGFLAAWIPARRAARVDPVTALRTE